jgi:hypothetical protein
MIAKTYTCSLLGIDAILVEVEVDLASGLPGSATVGLPDNIVKASRTRQTQRYRVFKLNTIKGLHQLPAALNAVTISPRHIFSVCFSFA